jgi:hypothetical protein
LSATDLVERYFNAMAVLDVDSMVGCWHAGISHSDPLFEDLRGRAVRARWDWQAANTERLELQHNMQFVDERKAQIGWQAKYLFKGRPVGIAGRTVLTLWDDTIVRQIDEFEFAQWCGQAIGPLWFVLGRIGALRRYQRAKLRAALAAPRNGPPACSGRPAKR